MGRVRFTQRGMTLRVQQTEPPSPTRIYLRTLELARRRRTYQDQQAASLGDYQGPIGSGAGRRQRCQNARLAQGRLDQEDRDRHGEKPDVNQQVREQQEQCRRHSRRQYVSSQ